VKIKIFWCKVNKYYTDKWINSNYLKNKTWIFVATCVVTDKAKRKWVKFVKDETKKLKSSWEKIFISWCWAFKHWKVQNNFFNLYPELKEFENKIELLGEEPSNISNSTLIEEKTSPQPSPLEERELKQNSPILTRGRTNLFTKKFILIQSWCDNFCSYCLTVIKRWKHFSRNKKDILKEILDFEKNWWKEIVLTWINLWAWWLENTNDFENSKLWELLEYLILNTKIKRIRISSLWPEFIDEKCLELFKNKRIYPHFHYSVQSWSTKVLKKMNRHYSWGYLKTLLLKTKNIKREDWINISIWADIIVWFPWETEIDFLDTYNLVKEVWIQKVHAFPFSAHKYWESVAAWFFPKQIEEKTKKERLEKLNKLSKKIRNDFILSQKWKTLEVLIESVKNWNWKWWTQNYIEANNNNFEIISWEIKRNEIVIWNFF